MAPGDDNRAWERHIAVDVTGQEAVPRMALAADMEGKGDRVVAPVVDYWWNSEGFALQDSATVTRLWV